MGPETFTITAENRWRYPPYTHGVIVCTCGRLIARCACGTCYPRYTQYGCSACMPREDGEA